MDALVVYESVYGNTRAIAEAIAEGIGGASVLPVHEATGTRSKAELLVVGGPTHMHGLATASSRRGAVEGAMEDGASNIEPGATKEPGLRTWLRDLAPSAAYQAAAFDTRLDKSPWLTGAAARAIAKRLRHRGFDVLGTESFLVEHAEGPLEDGELERARAWGAALAEARSRIAGQPIEA